MTEKRIIVLRRVGIAVFLVVFLLVKARVWNIEKEIIANDISYDGNQISLDYNTLSKDNSNQYDSKGNKNTCCCKCCSGEEDEEDTDEKGDENSEDTPGNEDSEEVPKSIVISGKLTYAKEEKVYYYEAPVTGRYRFDFDINDVNFAYVFQIIDSRNSEVAYSGTWKSGETVDLVKNEKYKIVITQRSGEPEYYITVGIPSEEKLISGNEIAGTIGYIGQIDRYIFKAPKTGRYYFAFDISDVTSAYHFRIVNAKNKELVDTGSFNSGKNVDLNEGEEYKIEISYRSGFADYLVDIGIPQ